MVWRVMIVVGCLVFGWSARGYAADPVVLDVRTETTGGMLATATILFPVGPAIIERLLTDYAHWPELFDVRMRMAEIREQDSKVFTDIRIEHALLPSIPSATRRAAGFSSHSRDVALLEGGHGRSGYP